MKILFKKNGNASFSYGDISSATMFQDMNKIIFGSVLMFIFMLLSLSKFGWIELRVIFYRKIDLNLLTSMFMTKSTPVFFLDSPL